MKGKVNEVFQILSESIILFLAPAAMLTTVNYFVEIAYLGIALKLLNTMVCGYLGYKLSESSGGTKIANITTMIVALVTSRSIHLIDEQLVLRLGDLITAIVMSLLTIYFVKKIGQVFGSYSLLLVTPISLLIMIPIGNVAFKGSSIIVGWIASTIENFTQLQPTLMGGLLAVSFGLLIVSPLSSVAVASILGVTGIVAGAASIGIVMIGLGLLMASLRVNGFIKSLAIMIGSPKIMMQNIFSKPKIVLPYLVSMFCMGAIFGYVGVENTTQGAGFGSVGFVGIVDFFISNPTLPLFKQLVLIFFLPITLSLLVTYIGIKSGVLKKEDIQMKFQL